MQARVGMCFHCVYSCSVFLIGHINLKNEQSWIDWEETPFFPDCTTPTWYIIWAVNKTFDFPVFLGGHSVSLRICWQSVRNMLTNFPTTKSVCDGDAHFTSSLHSPNSAAHTQDICVYLFLRGGKPLLHCLDPFQLQMQQKRSRIVQVLLKRKDYCCGTSLELGPIYQKAALYNCWFTDFPLFSQVSQLGKLLPLPEDRELSSAQAA